MSIVVAYTTIITWPSGSETLIATIQFQPETPITSYDAGSTSDQIIFPNQHAAVEQSDMGVAKHTNWNVNRKYLGM